MTLYADDPDVHNTYPVTNKVGTDLTFEPVVAVSGYGNVDAEWVSAPGPQRDLKVPLYGLPAGVVMQLRLKVPDGNDLDLGRVTLIGTSLGSNPGPEPGGPVAWADITGKPSTFPPAPHAHDDRYYTQAKVDDLLEGVAVGPASIDHGSVGSTLTISTAGSHELDLTGNLAVTVSTEGDVSLRAHGTGSVSVAGQSFDVDGVGVILVVTWPRGQDAYMIGGVAGEAPDSTPPTNMSGLSVSPNSDGVSANATWVAATDAQSDVKYRARVYPTGGTVPAWPTSGPLYDITGTSVTLTGLSPSTDYTVQMHAYSAGGASATVAATFSTPSAPPVEPTWTYTENFTPNGAIIGRALTTGGVNWTAGTGAGQGGAESAPTATGGKAVNVDGPAEGAQITLPQANAAAQIDYSLVSGGRVYLWLTSVDSTNSLTVTIQGTQVYLFRGGPSLVTLSGDFTDVPASGTLTVYYNDGAVTIVTGAGTATATMALNSSFTGTGRKCGFTTYGIGTTVDNFKAALL